MSDEIPYDLQESIIKDGATLSQFKETHYWPVVRELIESEIRACFRAFLSKTEMKMNANMQLVESPLTDDDMKNYRARAMGAKEILEMIDGKISDMKVWIENQQKKSDDDSNKVADLFAFHRSRVEPEPI